MRLETSCFFPSFFWFFFSRRLFQKQRNVVASLYRILPQGNSGDQQTAL
jgi:hypothetical protein